jgi:hypothetical protein
MSNNIKLSFFFMPVICCAFLLFALSPSLAFSSSLVQRAAQALQGGGAHEVGRPLQSKSHFRQTEERRI